jgi:hypothetical protein
MVLFITQVAGLLESGAMLRESCFGKWIGVPGLAGYGLMVVFFILTAFFPAYFDIAIVISMPGGLILMSYEILLARKFFQLGR